MDGYYHRMFVVFCSLSFFSSSSFVVRKGGLLVQSRLLLPDIHLLVFLSLLK